MRFVGGSPFLAFEQVSTDINKPHRMRSAHRQIPLRDARVAPVDTQNVRLARDICMIKYSIRLRRQTNVHNTKPNRSEVFFFF